MNSLQLWFVLFVSMLLQNQSHGKPYESHRKYETGQSSSDEKNAIMQAVQNATSGIRGKREVTYNLTDLCQTPRYQLSTSPKGCLKGWYYCYGYADAVCDVTSFQCFGSILQYGYPKCTPVHKFKTIDLGSKGKLKVKITTGCKCA